MGFVLGAGAWWQNGQILWLITLIELLDAIGPDPEAEPSRNVRRIREKSGLTQEELAESSGFSQQYISGREKGLRNPTILTLYEIARALKVSHVELVKPDKGVLK
jgi:DNA-binding XRE family transcriptional regulator